MRDHYQKAMDDIVLSEELKNKIKYNVMHTPKKHTAKTVHVKRVSGLAACLLLSAGSFFVFIHESTPPAQPPLAASAPPNQSSFTVQETDPSIPNRPAETSAPNEKNVAAPSNEKLALKAPPAIFPSEELPPPQSSETVEKPKDSLPDDTLFAENPPAQSGKPEDTVPDNPDTEVTPPGNVLVGSPFQLFHSIGELKENLPFEAKTPVYLPEGYEISNMGIMNGDLAQITYEKEGSDTLTYRAWKGLEDCSGDYTSYEKEDTVTVNGTDVILKSNSGIFFSVVWEHDNVVYSLLSKAGLTKSEWIKIIQSIIDF